jgi:hypothetical protein
VKRRFSWNRNKELWRRLMCQTCLELINHAVSLSCPVILASIPLDSGTMLWHEAITAQRIFLKTGDYEAFLEAVATVRRGPHHFT